MFGRFEMAGLRPVFFLLQISFKKANKIADKYIEVCYPIDNTKSQVKDNVSEMLDWLIKKIKHVSISFLPVVVGVIADSRD